MRAFSAVLFTAALLFASPASADLLWDNFISQPDGYDHITGRSSDRDTMITEAWTADDAIFSGDEYPFGVVVEEIRWIGARSPGVNFASADFIILDDQFQVVSEVWGIDYSATVIGSDFGIASETYVGSIDLAGQAVDVALDPGRYYFATRLADSFLGQNFIMSTGDGQMNGGSYGAFQSPFFGVWNWQTVDQIPGATVTEFAYQVLGTPGVPEPGALSLIGLGALALLRRR